MSPSTRPFVCPHSTTNIPAEASIITRLLTLGLHVSTAHSQQDGAQENEQDIGDPALLHLHL